MSSTAPAQTLRALLTRPGGKLVVAPGVFDGISVRVARRLGFEALYMTGYGTVASHLGLPDAGLASYRDMVERVASFAGLAGATPLIADADTGYGGLLNVEHTVRGYEAAGAAAIQLEDQEFPKKCGHTPGRRVVPRDVAAAKVRVAVQSRTTSSGEAAMLVVARTDARTALGLDEALRRAEAFAAAGADVLFVEAPESVDEMATIGRTFGRDVPLLVNVVEGGKTPVLTSQEYEDLGYRLAIYPATAFLAMGRAVEDAYVELRDTGASVEAAASGRLYDFGRFSKDVMGFDDVWAFEREHAHLEENAPASAPSTSPPQQDEPSRSSS